MQNLLSEYRTIKNIVMGVRNRGSLPLKYPHSIDKDLLALYAQGLTIPEISRKVGITIGHRFKKGFRYDKTFWEKYKRGEVALP